MTVTKLQMALSRRLRNRAPNAKSIGKAPTQLVGVISVTALLVAMAVGSTAPVLASTPVQVTFTTFDKPYDGTTSAAINTSVDCTLAGVASEDDVTCIQTSATASFDSRNAGLQTVTGDILSFSLDGANANDYHISGATSTATISQATLDITAVTQTRDYNGTTSSTGTPTTGAGQLQSTDTLTAAQAFDSRDVGSRTLSVIAGYSVNDGNGGLNYLVTTHTASGSISQKHLDVYAVTDSRGYNGTTSSSATPTFNAGDIQTGDTMPTLTQSFGSRNAGPGTLSVGAFVVGDANSGANYDVQTHTASGSISQAPMIVNAVTFEKTADGTTSVTATPTFGSTVFTGDNTTGSFTETFATAAAGFPKVLTPAGLVNDGNFGLNYSYTYNTFATGRIRPGAVANLAFTAQPIDTKINTPILNTCAPGGSPCAAGSASVQVTARDQYGNLAGPGSPGADTTVPVKVVIAKDIAGGAVIGPALGTATSAGIASFGTTLNLAGTFTGHMRLYASTTSPATNTTSDDFRIVNDLAPCNSPTCKNNIGNGGNAKNLQYLYGQINSNGTYAATTLTTQFVGVNQVDSRCGSNRTINSGVELRASGNDVNSTASGYMLLIIPKDTLKALGITNRGTPSFNVCLGTLSLGDGTPGTYGSQRATWNTLTGLASERQDTIALDGDTYWRYWGTPANCGARGLTATDPCISLRTKAKSDITALINRGILSSGADLNMRDADLAIVIKKPSPWDGKGGVY